MEVDEGFILGVYNYCDRWCEKCPFTSRCRVFADVTMHDADGTSELEMLRAAPPHPSDIRPPNKFLEELLAGMDQTTLEEPPEPPPMPAALMRVVAHSHAYCDDVWSALQSEEHAAPRPNDDPYSIILWFAPLISSKTHRAMSGLHEFDGCRDYPPDHEGSAKVALIGIDQSMQAWTDAQAIGRIPGDVAAGFIEKLHRLSLELEELVPRARAFVRPAFDEPDEVRRLEATDWS